MVWFQSISHVLLRGSRQPREVARLRVMVGVWLLALTAIFVVADHGAWWAWPLVLVAVLHFVLAYRLVRSDGRHA
jgi:4-hydroxybenzoate polyprenyltransferase